MQERRKETERKQRKGEREDQYRKFNTKGNVNLYKIKSKYMQIAVLWYHIVSNTIKITHVDKVLLSSRLGACFPDCNQLNHVSANMGGIHQFMCHLKKCNNFLQICHEEKTQIAFQYYNNKISGYPLSIGKLSEYTKQHTNILIWIHPFINIEDFLRWNYGKQNMRSYNVLYGNGWM